jgi:hypothetical protein
MDPSELIKHIKCAKNCKKYEINMTYDLNAILHGEIYFGDYIDARHFCSNYIPLVDDHNSCLHENHST